MNKELKQWIAKYNNMFEDSFPMIPLGWYRTEEEVIDLIKECLEKKKDAYELGYAEDIEGGAI